MTGPPVRVLVVDDQQLVRESIAALLDLQPGIVVVGTAGDGRAAVDQALELPRGVRYSMQLGFRPSSLQWGQREAWAARSFTNEWVEFVDRATPRQLEAVGFPPPGHPYWTSETLAGVALRYPALDLSPWHADG